MDARETLLLTDVDKGNEEHGPVRLHRTREALLGYMMAGPCTH